jgi:hypothetical protein
VPNEALELFQQHQSQGALYQALEKNGWTFTQYHNSGLFSKESELAVVKLFDPADEFQDQYFRFIQKIIREKITPQEFPHLPVVYAAERGIVILEKLYCLDRRFIEYWSAEVLTLSFYINDDSTDEEIQQRFGGFFLKYPTLQRTMKFILDIGTRYVADDDDVMQRLDGTPVIFDPLV